MPYVALYKSAKKLEWQDKPTDTGELRSAYRIAAENEPSFVRAYNRLARNMLDDDAMARLRKALRRVDSADRIGTAVDELEFFNPAAPSGAWGRALSDFERVYERTVEASGKAAASRGIEIRGLERQPVRKARIQYSFDLDNPWSIPWIQTHSAQLIDEVSDKVKKNVRRILEEGFSDGLTIDQMANRVKTHVFLLERESVAVDRRRALLISEGSPFQRAIVLSDRYAKQLLNQRAKRIARTETITAEARGLQDSWLQARTDGLLVEGVEREWIASPQSPRTCKICLDLDDKKAPLDEPFKSTFLGTVMLPPAHVMCLPDDALVTASGVTATMKRRFQGDFIIIRTAGKKKLTVTPNHPVLTDRGFIAAHLIQVGSRVVSCSVGDGAAFRVNDVEDVPSFIQKEAKAFWVSSLMSNRPMIVSPEDFHGDGRAGDIATVRADGELLNYFNASSGKHVAKEILKNGDMGIPELTGLGGLLHRSHASLGTTDRITGRFGQSQALFSRRLGHPDNPGCAIASRGDAIFNENFSDGRRADAESFYESIRGHTSEVFLDDVIGIDVVSTSSHVFNLETKSGWYIADGLVVHNCRCTLGLVVKEEP